MLTWDFKVKVNVWNILIAIMSSGITAYLLSKFVVGKKVDRVISFWKEEDRKKTEEAIANLGWLKFILEGEKKNELEIDRYMREKSLLFSGSTMNFWIFLRNMKRIFKTVVISPKVVFLLRHVT